MCQVRITSPQGVVINVVEAADYFRERGEEARASFQGISCTDCHQSIANYEAGVVSINDKLMHGRCEKSFLRKLAIAEHEPSPNPLDFQAASA